MGNAASCTPSLTANGVFKVLFLDGRIESYTKPIRAAELMLEYPGQFVCDSTYLKVGHRIQGLLADEEIGGGWRSVVEEIGKGSGVVAGVDPCGDCSRRRQAVEMVVLGFASGEVGEWAWYLVLLLSEMGRKVRKVGEPLWGF